MRYTEEKEQHEKKAPGRIIFVQNMSDLFAEAVPDELVLDVLNDLDAGRMGVLNKATGNMFSFVTHTYNPIGGKCPHECKYCYVEPQLKKPVLANKYSGDPVKIAGRLTPKGTDNRFLFLTKNPARYLRMKDRLQKPNYVLGTTLETDVTYADCKAPPAEERAKAMAEVSAWAPVSFVSIEPIMTFTDRFARMLAAIQPTFLAIGADSQGHNLTEPDDRAILGLISDIQRIPTRVKECSEFEPCYRAEMLGHPMIYLKENLGRLLSEYWINHIRVSMEHK